MIKISQVGYKGKPAIKGRANKIVEIEDINLLAEYITEHHWAPSIFKADDKGQRARKKANFESTSLIVLDVDDGRTINEAKQDFAEYKHIIATTKSHQKPKGASGKKCDRFRVILFLESEITDSKKFTETWFEVYEKFPYIDKACKDSSRFFYASENVVAVQAEGALVPISEGAVVEAKGEITNDINNLEGKRPLSARATAYLLRGEGIVEGERHDNMIAVLKEMRQQGYSEDEAYLMCQRANELVGNTWGPKQEGRVRQIYAEDSSNYYKPREFKTKRNSKGEWVIDKDAYVNYQILLEKLGIKPYFDEFSLRTVYDPNEKGDLVLAKLYTEAMHKNLTRGKEHWVNILDNEAMKNRRNPVKDALKNHEIEEGRDYIKELSESLIGPDPEWTYKMLRKWLIGIIAKVYAPQKAQNFVLVLKGAQGIGKSRWFDKLVEDFGNPNLFAEGHLKLEDKDTTIRLLDTLIFHLSELEAITSKREAGELKSFLTQNTVTVRRPYERMDTVGYSKCSFCASVNNDEFLVDLTGNRRFVVIELDEVVVNHKVKLLDVFTYAKKCWENGEAYWIESEEIASLNERNEKYRLKDPLDDAVSDFVKPGEDFVSSREILEVLNIKEERKYYTKLKNLLLKNEVEYCVSNGRRGYKIDRELLEKGRP